MPVDINSYAVLTGFAALLVGLSKGGLPTVGMLAVPLLAIYIPPLEATTLLLPIYVISDLVGVYLYRKAFSLINLKILIPSGVMGVGIGWSVSSLISAEFVSLFIGIIGVCFCLSIWLRKSQTTRKEPQIKTGIFWGLLSGFTSFISHAGGPPFQIFVLPQKLPKLQFAGTSTILFAVINAAKIIPYENLRPYSINSLTESLMLIPIALMGTYLGAYLTRKIHEKIFFTFIQVSLFLISCKLIYNSLSG